MRGQIVSFASIELERAPAVARSAETLGSVTIYGLRELQCAKPIGPDFIEAWRDAICFEIGVEGFEKFCLGRRNR